MAKKNPQESYPGLGTPDRCLPVLSLSFMQSPLWLGQKSGKPKTESQPSAVLATAAGAGCNSKGRTLMAARWKLYNFTIEQYCDQYLVRICNKETP